MIYTGVFSCVLGGFHSIFDELKRNFSLHKAKNAPRSTNDRLINRWIRLELNFFYLAYNSLLLTRFACRKMFTEFDRAVVKIVSSWNDEVKLNRAAPQRKCTSLLAVAKPDLVLV